MNMMISYQELVRTFPSYFPGMAGDIGGSVGSELSGKYIEQKSSQEDRKK